MTHWENYPELSGPQLFGATRSQVVIRCALVRNVSGGPCEFGFTNQQKDVIPREIIKKEVANYLIANNLHIGYYDQLYVLTISPTVVILIPDQKKIDSESQNAGNSSSDIHSQMEHLMYGRNPVVGRNSLIFIAPSQSPPTQIADNTESFEFPLPDSNLKITAMGTHWSVLRSSKPTVNPAISR